MHYFKGTKIINVQASLELEHFDLKQGDIMILNRFENDGIKFKVVILFKENKRLQQKPSCSEELIPCFVCHVYDTGITGSDHLLFKMKSPEDIRKVNKFDHINDQNAMEVYTNLMRKHFNVDTMEQCMLMCGIEKI